MAEKKALKLDELINASKRILDAQSNDKQRLLFDSINEDPEEIKDLIKITESASLIADPEKSYDLFYHGIQRFLLAILPKEDDIKKVILELKSILLTGKEKSQIKYGRRGADSRMAPIPMMEAVIDVITDWSKTPHDFMRLAVLLLDKNKTLGYIPEERELSDYI
ncbi:hypothetical protein EYV94_27290 [Puteibacter caeruleilacunae]|nr:hypothetical protein EYV94_27290 [Puteibacter caeruleilacunae]